MKQLLIISALLLFVASCKQKDETKTMEKERTPVENIAYANGLDQWAKVSELHFTFNVDRDTTHFERSWIWHPKTDDVVMISGKDTISYNRNAIDSTSMKADKAFINDKYWLLAPFQLSWDSSATIYESSKAEAPISKIQMNKITITYPNEGGYTPGDAYDLFYDDDFIVREWNYRKGNAEVPTMSTTWDDYEKFKGLHISKTHNKPNEDWKLYFTDIKVSH